MANLDNNVTVGQNQNITNVTRDNAAAFIAQNFPVTNNDPAAATVTNSTTTTNTTPASQLSPVVNGGSPTTQTVTPVTATTDNTFQSAPANTDTKIDNQKQVTDQIALNQAVQAQYDANQKDTTEDQSAAETNRLKAAEKEAADAAANQSSAETQRLQNQNKPGVSLPVGGSVNAAQGAKQLLQSLGKQSADDWRVRMSLAKSSNYLYNDPNIKPTDLLYPLRSTGGVLFPYTPAISVAYRANYEGADLVHSNYKTFFYKNSSVDDFQITCDFTAQDTQEANYMLAVIHFFKSVTKMFYGQDPYKNKTGPRAGTPPPLVYLTGLGQYQFDHHPLAITNFNYSLPADVDYIRAGTQMTWDGQNISTQSKSVSKTLPSGSSIIDAVKNRLKNNGLGTPAAAGLTQIAASLANGKATYVPTKIQIQISAHPIVTRNDISNTFSLGEYASGGLNKGGIW